MSRAGAIVIHNAMDFESPDRELPFGTVSGANLIFQVTLKLLQVNGSHLLGNPVLNCRTLQLLKLLGF